MQRLAFATPVRQRQNVRVVIVEIAPGTFQHAREREIVSMILQGHSTESVALRLDISPGTVKVHRKNIYRKLKVSSQGELFAAFMGLSPAHQPYIPRDIPGATDIPQSRVKIIAGGKT